MEKRNPKGQMLVFHGHPSASPEKVSHLFSGDFRTTADPTADAAIFAVNPAAGIDAHTIELWHSYTESQVPRLVVVTTLPGTEMDFDDAVLIANRVFDQLVTPFLVLHGLDGTPVGLIELTTLKTFDYSQTPPTEEDAESDLQILVEEFRNEYMAQMEEMGSDSFSAGIVFPAIPINIENGLGVDKVMQYLEELPRRS